MRSLQTNTTRASFLIFIVACAFSSANNADSKPVSCFKLQDQSLKTLVGLIQLETSRPAGNEHLAASFVAERLDEADIPYKLFERSPVERALLPD